MRNIMFGAITEAEDFDAWASYIGVFDSSPDTVAYQPSLIDWLIKTTYAAPISTFVEKLRELRVYAVNSDLFYGNTDKMIQVGRLLTKSIKTLNASTLQEIGGLKFKDDMLTALISVDLLVPGKGMRNILEASKDHVSAYEKFLNDFVEVANYSKMNEDPLLSGITRVVTDLGAGWRKQRGSIHQIAVIRRAIANNEVIEAIEETVDISITMVGGAKKQLSKRVYDSIHRVGDVRKHIEAKAWSPQYAVENLKRSMRADKIIVESADEIGEKVVDATEKPGQLLRDLALMYEKRGDPNFKIEWHFDHRSANPDDMTQVYLEAIKDELESVGGDKLRAILEIPEGDAWDDALVQIFDELDKGFIKVLSE